MEKPFKYDRVETILNIYPQSGGARQIFPNVDAIPRAGTLDLLLPMTKTKGTEVLSIPWTQIKYATRVVLEPN